jgi:photosystem II stability/assembly factor-like uncharacterized protein
MCLPRAVRPLPSSHRAAVFLAAALLPLAAGCSSPESQPTAATPSATAPGRLPSAHVHGVAIAPADGTFLLATHDGLIQVGDGGELAQISPAIDLMGFAVAGDDRYLASGHPGPGVDLPQPVGLIESTDGGGTWAALSRQGQSDFHALTVSDAGVLGWDGTLVRSLDGRTWEQLDIPAEPHTLAAAPDGSTVLATTQQGLLRSTDAGSSWAPVAGAPLLQVVDWADDGTTAAGVDPAGTVWTSTDAAGTWRQGARLGSAPDAVAAASADGGGLRIAAVTADGLLESDDGGQTFTVVLER